MGRPLLDTVRLKIALWGGSFLASYDSVECSGGGRSGRDLLAWLRFGRSLNLRDDRPGFPRLANVVVVFLAEGVISQADLSCRHGCKSIDREHQASVKFGGALSTTPAD